MADPIIILLLSYPYSDRAFFGLVEPVRGERYLKDR